MSSYTLTFVLCILITFKWNFPVCSNLFIKLMALEITLVYDSLDKGAMSGVRCPHNFSSFIFQKKIKFVIFILFHIWSEIYFALFWCHMSGLCSPVTYVRTLTSRLSGQSMVDASHGTFVKFGFLRSSIGYIVWIWISVFRQINIGEYVIRVFPWIDRHDIVISIRTVRRSEWLVSEWTDILIYNVNKRVCKV